MLGAFLKLGCTSFGGPVAHLGYFQNEFVARRKWISEAHYADIVALCQFLPGPASSQVGLVIGWKRAGWKGALAAWLGFTMPSVALMVAFAYGVRSVGGLSHAGLSLLTTTVFLQARPLPVRSPYPWQPDPEAETSLVMPPCRRS